MAASTASSLTASHTGLGVVFGSLWIDDHQLEPVARMQGDGQIRMVGTSGLRTNARNPCGTWRFKQRLMTGGCVFESTRLIRFPAFAGENNQGFMPTSILAVFMIPFRYLR